MTRDLGDYARITDARSTYCSVRKLAITLPQQVVLGAILGIAAGIVFGERTTVLQPIGNAYGAMLQIAVFPYILCSLMHGLGSLSPAVARRMLRAGWLPFLFLWVLTFASIWLLAHAIPSARSPALLSGATDSQTIPLTQLLIPSNPFSALHDNYVPAVVVFAIIYGIALQKIANKNTLLEILNTVQVASVTIWRWVIVLAPLGVFALLATTAGTVHPNRLTGLLCVCGALSRGSCDTWPDRDTDAAVCYCAAGLSRDSAGTSAGNGNCDRDNFVRGGIAPGAAGD
jgi:Na+/H+-dicarboxylate symporter